jgi:hypothetical protein
MCTCLQTTAAEIVRTSKKTPGQVMEQIMHTNFSQNKNMHNLPCRQRFHQRKTMLATQIKKLKMLVMHFQFCQKKIHAYFCPAILCRQHSLYQVVCRACVHTDYPRPCHTNNPANEIYTIKIAFNF